MKINEVIKNMVTLAESDNGDKYFNIVHAIALIFPTNLVAPLQQLVNGPVWDGDVMSKSYRDELIVMGLATRVCCKGEQGYTGAKYTSFSILKMLTLPGSTR